MPILSPHPGYGRMDTGDLFIVLELMKEAGPGPRRNLKWHPPLPADETYGGRAGGVLVPGR